MNEKNLPLFGKVTPNLLLVPAFGALAIGLVYILPVAERPIRGATFGAAWMFIALVGSSARHVLRSQEKRIAGLEEELAKLRSGS